MSGSSDKRVRVWEAAAGSLLHTEKVNSVSFSGDGMRTVSGGTDILVRVWDAGTGGVMRVIEAQHDVYSVSLSADGSVFVSGGEPHGVWDATTVSADGTMIASGGMGHKVCVKPPQAPCS